MKRFFPQATLVPLLLACAVGCAAGVKKSTSGSGNSSGGSGSGGSTGSGTGGSGVVVPPPVPACDPCTDFPATPLTDGSPPANVGTIFGDPSSGAGNGPCVFEPQDRTLFPNNWLRPRFRWTAVAGSDLYELRVHAANQQNDLVVYTTQTLWTMPKEMWQALAAHTRDADITTTVRSAKSAGGGVAKGSPATFTIAPVGAGGTLVYWSTSGTTMGTPTGDETQLSGFSVGDESVVTVLTPQQSLEHVKDSSNPPVPKQPTPPATTYPRCIGCHTSTPDGLYISYNDFYPWDIVLANSKPDATGLVGQLPPWIRAGGFNAITLPWLGIATYSIAFWSDDMSDHRLVVPMGTTTSDIDQRSSLFWISLDNAGGTGSTLAALTAGGAIGEIARTGDTGYAAAPSWSHDGTFIVYTSTSSVVSGRIGTGTAHLYRVPFNDGAGGPATAIPLDGAAASADYYGSLSHDDKLIAFNRIPAATAATKHTPIGNSGATSWDGMYAQPQSEVFVAPVDGGAPVRLEANDPPQCPGAPASPGINNTWAKWSPEIGSTFSGKRYYWLIFSSWRDGATAADGTPIAQLYVTGVTQDETSTRSYSAIYLWNQPANISNHTPAWDVFQIPTVK